MKRRIAMMLVLVMLMALILPQTALAVPRYYLTVSITDGTDTVTGTTGYLSLTGDSLTGGVVQVVTEKWDNSYGEFRVFGSHAMNAIVRDGLNAYNNSTWNTWVTSYAADPMITNWNAAAQGIDLKACLVDLNTKVGALSEGVPYQISYTPGATVAPSTDAAYGKTYVVTITLNSSTTGGTASDLYDVIVKDASNGGAKASPIRAAGGQTITVTVEPDNGYVISRIIVTDESGNSIRPRCNGGNKFTFTMPESDAYVTPVFRKKTVSPEESGVADFLNVDDHIAFMVGDNKGNFRPNAPITRAEVAQIFYRLLRDEIREAQSVELMKRFDDVADNAWYATAVNTLASLGIINGTSATTFAPNRSITRAEFIAICTRFSKKLTGTSTFTDVPASFWAYNNIAAAADMGWVVGSGTGKFNPNASITRTEAAAIVNRMLGRLGDFDTIDAGAGRRFPDVSATFWGFYDIVEATTAHDYAFDSDRLYEDWK